MYRRSDSVFKYLRIREKMPITVQYAWYAAECTSKSLPLREKDRIFILERDDIYILTYFCEILLNVKIDLKFQKLVSKLITFSIDS